MSKSKSEILKSEIIRQYKSINKFCQAINIPYTTLSSALNNHIEGMAYGTVLKICSVLKLNPIDFNPINRVTKQNEIIDKAIISYYYSKLNEKGRSQLKEILEDMTALEKYTI